MDVALKCHKIQDTLWLFIDYNIVMAKSPFFIGKPRYTIHKWAIFHGYVSHNQMVNVTSKLIGSATLPADLPQNGQCDANTQSITTSLLGPPQKKENQKRASCPSNKSRSLLG